MFDRPKPLPRSSNKNDQKSPFSYSPNLVKEVTAVKPSTDSVFCKRICSLIRKSSDITKPCSNFLQRTNSLRSFKNNSDELFSKNEPLCLTKSTKDNRRLIPFKSLSCDNLNKPNNEFTNAIFLPERSRRKRGKLKRTESKLKIDSDKIDPDKLRILRIEMSILLYIIRESSSNYGMKLLRIECINIVKRYIHIMNSVIMNIPFSHLVKLLKILEEILLDIQKHIVFFYVYFKDLLLVLYRMDSYLGLSILKDDLEDLVRIVDENYQKVHCRKAKQIQILIQYLHIPESINNPQQQIRKFLPSTLQIQQSTIQLFNMPQDHWSYRLKRLLHLKVSFKDNTNDSKLMLVFSPISHKSLLLNNQKVASGDLDNESLTERNKPFNPSKSSTVPIFKLLFTKVQAAFLECPLPIKFGTCVVQLPDSSIHEVRSLPFALQVKASSRQLSRQSSRQSTTSSQQSIESQRLKNKQNIQRQPPQQRRRRNELYTEFEKSKFRQLVNPRKSLINLLDKLQLENNVNYSY